MIYGHSALQHTWHTNLKLQLISIESSWLSTNLTIFIFFVSSALIRDVSISIIMNMEKTDVQVYQRVFISTQTVLFKESCYVLISKLYINYIVIKNCLIDLRIFSLNSTLKRKTLKDSWHIKKYSDHKNNLIAFPIEN